MTKQEIKKKDFFKKGNTVTVTFVIKKVGSLEELETLSTRRQMAISLRDMGWTYKKIAVFMGINQKSIWMHLTNKFKPSFTVLFIL